LKQKRSSADNPERLSNLSKYNLDATLEHKASTCASHLRSLQM